MTAITGKTYPVRKQLHDLGGEWDGVAKAWMVPDERADEARALVAGWKEMEEGTRASTPMQSSWGRNGQTFSYSACQVCGKKRDRYTRIYRSGECRDCYEERKMGY